MIRPPNSPISTSTARRTACEDEKWLAVGTNTPQPSVRTTASSSTVSPAG